jgi:hypothetical protein
MERINLDIPLISSPSPERIVTTQKDMSGTPKIISRATMNKNIAEIILQLQKWYIFLYLRAYTTEEMLSKMKYIPIRAISHSKLTFGTKSIKTPIAVRNIPIDMQ